jgi:serine protease inhibitor
MTSIAEPVRADAAFGTDLYEQLAGPGSLVFSPASIAAALRMALVGARGDTAAELAAALHLPGPEAAADGLGQLAAIRGGDDLTFRAPNVMWLEESVHVREEFLRQLAGTVSVERCDFLTAPEAARQAINNEIAEQTDGKITGLIPKGAIDPATRLVLTNAVYLKALWVHQFPVKDTKKRDFYPERTGPSPVDMMHLQERLAYHRGDGYEAVLLPYRDGSLAMAVVLPDGPLSDFTGTLAGAGGSTGCSLPGQKRWWTSACRASAPRPRSSSRTRSRRSACAPPSPAPPTSAASRTSRCRSVPWCTRLTSTSLRRAPRPPRRRRRSSP